MTETEAGNFVREVLQGLWNRWNPKQAEIDAWIGRLWAFDYYKAKAAVYRLFFSLDNRKIDPPAGKIMEMLNTYAFTSEAKKPRQAHHLYTLVKKRDIDEGRTGGYEFASAQLRKPPVKEEIERQAEDMRNRLEHQYGCKFVIIYAKIDYEQPAEQQQIAESEIPF